jgi:hypothetical protein
VVLLAENDPSLRRKLELFLSDSSHTALFLDDTRNVSQGVAAIRLRSGLGVFAMETLVIVQLGRHT